MYERECKTPEYSSSILVVPSLFLLGTGFMEDSFSTDEDRGDCMGMIQAHYIYCTLCF